MWALDGKSEMRMKRQQNDHFHTVLHCGRRPLPRTVIWDYGARNLQH